MASSAPPAVDPREELPAEQTTTTEEKSSSDNANTNPPSTSTDSTQSQAQKQPSQTAAQDDDDDDDSDFDELDGRLIPNPLNPAKILSAHIHQAWPLQLNFVASSIHLSHHPLGIRELTCNSTLCRRPR
ncbi:uncharacterized protein LDX57_004717 [Aspergillus melleus]|uniref:uncharacterized protein n=1 Tax=Aspergillus melleus TaxID=138277 RepID=UPI001E8DD025|nr:uncharacterized protein LDX57_004717 [Aspergillus melleus]KAH8426996.1 hypothetical protein LDX57_004717 [Aspergillus melleus]